MQEDMIGTRTCVDEQGTPHTFYYFLLTQQLPAGRFLFEDYGVKVAEAGADSTQLPGITHSRSHIQGLLTLLIGYAVSPTSLGDVVEDWAKENHLPQPGARQVVHVGQLTSFGYPASSAGQQTGQ